MKRKTIYYQTFNDNFTTIKLKARKIDSKYKYVHKNILYRFFSFVFYRLFAMPFSYIFIKLKHNIKLKNRKVLKQIDRKQGFFLYANHSMAHADPFIPTFAVFPRKNFLVVHPDNISQPIVGNIMPMLGAIPLPDDIRAGKNIMECLEYRIINNSVITIYPEASIWPYYNSVRPFPSNSFAYPIKYKCPVFCMTNTYQKSKFTSQPRVTTFIDGPFYPNTELSLKEQKEDLRNRVYECMKNRCDEFSTYEYIKYQKNTD